MLNTDKVERLRRRMKLTVEQAADAIGMTKQGWSNIARGDGNVTMATLHKLAGLLGCTARSLVLEQEKRDRKG